VGIVIQTGAVIANQALETALRDQPGYFSRDTVSCKMLKC